MNNTSYKAYTSWVEMRRRCRPNPKRRCNGDYAERGITVCPQWNDFKTFLLDMGERDGGMTLERINNDKGYSPDNCKWVTKADQNRNQTRSRRISFNGKTQLLVDWAREFGISKELMHWRLKNGWTMQRISDT